MITNEELTIIREEFISYMKKRHDGIEGRRMTLETLAIHIKRNILQDHIDRGVKELPENLNELIIDRYTKEFEAVINKIREGK